MSPRATSKSRVEIGGTSILDIESIEQKYATTDLRSALLLPARCSALAKCLSVYLSQFGIVSNGFLNLCSKFFYYALFL